MSSGACTTCSGGMSSGDAEVMIQHDLDVVPRFVAVV